MKQYSVALLSLAACGSPSDLIAVPDAIGLAGPGHARAFEVIGPKLERADDPAVAEDPAIARVIGRRVIGVAPGSTSIIIGDLTVPVVVGDLAPPYVSSIVAHQRGAGDGYGRDRLPGIISGPPKGGGLYQGSTDALSLGLGGSITVSFAPLSIYDGPGADLIVFENAFRVAGGIDVFAEPAAIEVGGRGVWTQFPCAPPDSGCAGVAPVIAGPGAPDVDPTDASSAGGDHFDLAAIELAGAELVRITDVATGTITGNNSGFDLDAVAIVHALPPDTRALKAAVSTIRARMGERVLLPRADLEGAVVLQGAAVIFEVEPPGAVIFDPPFFEARQIGRAVLTARAGPFRAQIDLEVEP